MSKYVTLVDSINELRAQGYDVDFNVRGECLACRPHGEFSPEEFRIDKVLRFEGATNPDDQAVLYALSSDKFNLRGILVNGYGISADQHTDDLIRRLRTHPDSEG